MIEIIEGRGVGAGKSYYACMRMISHLSQGGTVFASDTFGLKWDASARLCESRYGVIIEREQFQVFEEGDIKRLHEVTPQGTPELPVLIVVDECHGELNARDWNDQSKKAFFKWLTQSRHDDNDVIFISQSAHNIDKQVARLVTYISRVRNMRNFKFPGIGQWPLRQFVVNRFDQDGKTLLERKWIWHDTGIFGCYESKVMRGSHKRLNAAAIPRKQLKKPTLQKNNMAKFIIIAVIACALLAFWMLRNSPLLGGEEKNAKQPPPKEEKQEVSPPYMKSSKAAVSLRADSQLGAYDVFAEELRAQINDNMIRTDKGEYTVGRMSNHGLVVGIDNRVVRVIQPDARVAFIIAEDRTQQREHHVTTNTEAVKKEEPPAASEPPPPEKESKKVLVGGTVRNGKLIPFYGNEYTPSEAARAGVDQKTGGRPAGL
jgi:hypothetical protein